MKRAAAAGILSLAALGGCVTPLEPPPTASVGPLPERVAHPVDNPTSDEKVELGRLLFWDPILSGERDVACATCHHPDHGYADGRALSVGVGGVGLGPARRASTAEPHVAARNAMTVLDTAWNGVGVRDATPGPADAPMFWDNRARGLEGQARGPVRNADEMRGTRFTEDEIFPEVARRLAATPEYVERFERAFGPGPIDEDAIVRAIGAFERTLVARGSSFDRFMAGDDDALDFQQKRGLVELVDRGCTNCHSGPMFSDFRLHTLVPGGGHRMMVPRTRAQGGTMRTASLRNATRTAPYFQDGALDALDDVFDFYAQVDTTRDPDLAALRPPMDAASRADLAAFLRALGDGEYDRTVPARVPSGLPVGGAIR